MPGVLEAPPTYEDLRSRVEVRFWEARAGGRRRLQRSQGSSLAGPLFEWGREPTHEIVRG